MKNFLLFLILLLSRSLLAQYNDSTHYYAGFTSTGTYNQSPTGKSFLLSNGVKGGVRHKELAVNSNNKWLYGRQNGLLTNNDFSSSWDVNLYKTFPHFYYWGLLVYNTSYSLKVNNQFQSGAGIAYNFIDKKTAQLNVSDGIIYDYSDLVLTDDNNSREIYGTFRNSLRLQVKWNAGSIFSFNGNIFYQNSLSNGNDYIIRSDASLTIKIKKWLSLTSSLSYNKMSRTKKENFFATYGLTIEKYF